MTNEIRDLNTKCIYCTAEVEKNCYDTCFLEVFNKSVLTSPAFIPSKNISKLVGQLFAEELMAYMSLVTQALENMNFMGRMQALSKDYEDLHNFASSLHEAGKLQKGKEVLDFYKNPKQWENLSRMWAELGKPSGKRSESWEIYTNIVEDVYGK
tara:strand:- start:3729 stop:4190 length:462 start_codon:yes stop_codon:yes gene_type:complete